MYQNPRIRSIVLISALVFIWGISWPIYKYALDFTPPLLFAGFRTLFGGLALALYLLPRIKEIAFKKNYRIYLISAFLNVFLFFGLQSVGLTYMPGGLFSVIVYVQPMLVGIMAWFYLGESMTWEKLTGLSLGFLGVVAVSANGIAFSGQFTLEETLIGISLALLTAISWAFGIISVKKFGGETNALWLVAIQCILGGIGLTSIGLSVESVSDIVWNIPYISGLMFGVTLGVSSSWVIYYNLIRAGEASKVVAITFLVPLIAVFSSTLLLKESISLLLLLGLILIMFGIFIVNRKPR